MHGDRFFAELQRIAASTLHHTSLLYIRQSHARSEDRICSPGTSLVEEQTESPNSRTDEAGSARVNKWSGKGDSDSKDDLGQEACLQKHTSQLEYRWHTLLMKSYLSKGQFIGSPF